MKLFFSHSSKNKPLLREVRSNLPKWLQPWIDEDQLYFGRELTPALREGINTETDFFVLFFCSEAAKSAWVKKEVEWALEREKVHERVFVLPVLLDGTRDALKTLGVVDRVTIDLKDYTEHGIRDAANRIAEHVGSWMVKRFHEAARAEVASRAKVKELETAIKSAGNIVTGPLSKHFPYSIERLEKEVRFSLDGAGIQIQRWIGLKAHQSFSKLEIPWKFVVELSGSEIGATEAVEIEPSSGCVEFVDASIIEIDQRTKEVRGKFQILGHFGEESDPVSFECTQPFKKAFTCSREEAISEYGNTDWPEEYTSSTQIAAIASIVVRVIFPKEYRFTKSQPTPVAFIGNTHTIHSAETARIRNCLTIVDNDARLEVLEPVIGLRYAISWMPPATIAAEQDVDLNT